MQFVILVCKLTTLKMQEILKLNMYMALFYALLSASGTLYSELDWIGLKEADSYTFPTYYFKEQNVF